MNVYGLCSMRLHFLLGDNNPTAQLKQRGPSAKIQGSSRSRNQGSSASSSEFTSRFTICPSGS